MHGVRVRAVSLIVEQVSPGVFPRQKFVDTFGKVFGGHEDQTGPTVRTPPFLSLARMGVAVLSGQEGVHASVVNLLLAAKHAHGRRPMLEFSEAAQVSIDGCKRQVLQFVGFRHVILETNHAFVLLLMFCQHLLPFLCPYFLLLKLPCFPEDLVLVLLVELV